MLSFPNLSRLGNDAGMRFIYSVVGKWYNPWR